MSPGPPRTAAKVRCREEALSWRRARPGRVVFTNGVFDLLHRGHVECLEAARALGDSLIVGVNSDGSARGLAKGAGRPFVPAADRARLVAALEAVDCVVIFDEPTPLELVDVLRPDLIAKGGDYRREAMAGADLVESRGGRVAILPFLPDHSTSALVERIRGAR